MVLEAPAGGDGAIRIRELRKAFGETVVLDGVDLDIERGTSLALLGASGSGKTVLMKCALGLIEPDAGTVQIGGRETVGVRNREREDLMRKVGVLFQNGALFDSLPVWQNVAFGLVNGLGMAIEAAKAIAIEKLAMVGLEPEVAELAPAELSGGMQRRVALARAVAGDPAYIFLDSPTAGLDPIMTAIVDKVIVQIVRALRATTLIITHDLASARRIADRAAFLFEGRIDWEGPIDALDRSGNPHVEEWIRHAGIAA
jgi:phospholipid/cholesterol/gamma-HCH transport system ATP-binding protein